MTGVTMSQKTRLAVVIVALLSAAPAGWWIRSIEANIRCEILGGQWESYHEICLCKSIGKNWENGWCE